MSLTLLKHQSSLFKLSRPIRSIVTMSSPPSLPTRKLGKNGPEVTAIGWGAMGLSAFYGKPKSDEERFKILDHIFESGQLNWDSADVYGDSEDLLGKWFKKNPGKREKIFLATKFANYIDPKTGDRRVRNEPEYIQEAIDKSLKRLGIPYVDLYYCHRLQSDIPVEQTVAEMDKLRKAGKVKYIGLSECSAESLRRACKIAHIDAVQIEYSPFTMDIEDPKIGLLETCRELGVATIAYSPLGRGFLTGSIKSRADFEEGDWRLNAPRFSEENFSNNLELVKTLEQIANKKGCTPGQLVLAFLLAQGDDVIPIPGTTRVKNFDENMGALKIRLNKDEETAIRGAIEKTEVVGGRYPPAMSKALFADTVSA